MAEKIKINSLSGFTLVETLAAIGVFAIVSVTVANIFLNVNNLQRTTANFQRLQNDSRYMLEKMAREIRGREIQYPVASPWVSDLIFKKDESGKIVHICWDSANKNLKYYITQDQNDTIANCLAAGANLNADDVSVEGASFYVLPIVEDQWGSQPTVNMQPRVTIVLKVKNRQVNPKYQQELNLQTTISSKVYKR